MAVNNNRFEERVEVALSCHGVRMRRVGNLSLREAGAANTTIAYECITCFRRAAVVDEWPGAPPKEQAAINAEVDAQE